MNLFYCSIRQKKLLKTLLKANGYVTGQSLSAELLVSDRTIRNDVGMLNCILEDYQCQIISKRGKGYKLKSEDKELLTSILSKYVGRDQNQEREHLIITQLLNAKKPVDLFQLEESLYISRSTLNTELQNIKKTLNSLYPAIDLRRKNGKIELVGNETTLRFLFNELLMFDYEIGNQRLCSSDPVLNEEFLTMKELVSTTSANYSFEIDDNALADISAYLLITKKRLAMNKPIVKLNDDTFKKESAIDQLSQELAEKALTNFQNEQYFENEINQIAVKLSFINLFSSIYMTKDEIQQNTPKQIIDIVDSLIRNIQSEYGLDLSIDEDLYAGLVFHVSALINRVKYKRFSENPMLETIKKDYSFSFELSLHIYEIFKSIIGIKLNESEVSYIAAHLAASMERLRMKFDKTELRTVVISHLNPGYTQLIVSNLKNLFSNMIDIIGTYPLYKLEEALAEQPVILLSTCKLQRKKIPENCWYFHMNPVFSNEEQKKLIQFVEQVQNESLYRQLENQERKKETISDKFDEDLFFKDLNVKTKEEALALASNIMLLKGYVESDYLQKTLERENLSATVLDNMIAIPHPVQACAKKTVIGVITLNKPIPWGKYKVKLVFVLAIKREEKVFIREFFKFINTITKDPIKVDTLYSAKNFTDLKQQIKSYSEEVR